MPLTNVDPARPPKVALDGIAALQMLTAPAIRSHNDSGRRTW